jgi:UDP-N-acetylglucosamine:LPS N-acetylglucosamine transferase
VESLRERLSLDPRKKVILLLGGADGMPNGVKILKRLTQLSEKAEIICVCGKDRKFYDEASEIRLRTGFSSMKIFGFVDNVDEFVSIADVVVTKCGASTFMEILLCGKIPVVHRYLWGQEQGNVDYIRNNALGVYEQSVRRLARVVDRLITDASVATTMKQNIERTRLRSGTREVSQYLLQFQG